MKCPKCGYLGFEHVDRCRNCGYEFALTTTSTDANLRLRDEISRVPGVGDVVIFGGSNYSMRVWLDPEKL